MAEDRTKNSHILLTVNGKKIRLELFPADVWPSQNTGENLYRVCMDGRWHCPMGKYSFFTLAAVAELTASLLQDGVLAEHEPLPEWLVKGVEVQAGYGECFYGFPVHTYRDHTLDNAQLGPDGRWHALCQLYGKGRRFVLVADVKQVRR